jgi:quercetin dioxygenase-like cupin family protein
MDPIIKSDESKFTAISSANDASINWAGTFATYGGHGAEASCTVPFLIHPGGHLGWHTDSTEETQYIISGQGELRRDEGNYPVGPGDVFVLPALVGHDLANVGTEPLHAVAFFSGPVLEQVFDDVMLPPNSHKLKSPNSPT